MELLGGEQWEAVSKIEAHLIAEHAHRARSRAVCLCGTLGKDAVKERKILLHDIVMYTFFFFCYTDCVRTAGASSGTFLRVEVVGAVADVLLEANRHAVVREQHVAARRTVRQSHSLLTKISHGVSVGEINGGEG